MMYCELQRVFVDPLTKQYWLDGYWMPYRGDLSKLVLL